MVKELLEYFKIALLNLKKCKLVDLIIKPSIFLDIVFNI